LRATSAHNSNYVDVPLALHRNPFAQKMNAKLKTRNYTDSINRTKLIQK